MCHLRGDNEAHAQQHLPGLHRVCLATLSREYAAGPHKRDTHLCKTIPRNSFPPFLKDVLSLDFESHTPHEKCADQPQRFLFWLAQDQTPPGNYQSVKKQIQTTLFRVFQTQTLRGARLSKLTLPHVKNVSNVHLNFCELHALVWQRHKSKSIVQVCFPSPVTPASPTFDGQS